MLLVWLGTVGLILAVLGLVLWGLRKHPHQPSVAPALVPADPPSSPTPDLPESSATILGALVEDRRFLVSLWGASSPDLFVTLWSDPSRRSSRYTSGHQLFLPLAPCEDLLRFIEGQLKEGRPSTNAPESARPYAAYTFLYAAEFGRDLVVQSVAGPRGVTHRCYVLDGDGRLQRRRLDPEAFLDGYFPPDSLRWRAALAQEQGVEALAGEFSALEFLECFRADSHAWVAHVAALAGDPPALQRRHLALAAEWSGNSWLVRLQKARLEGPAALRGCVRELHHYVSEQSDRAPETTFLLAQSLLALQQTGAAKALCERLLLQIPEHGGATRLLRLIEQKDQGVDI